MDEQELKQLVERTKQGDEDAWQKLYNEMRRSPTCRSFHYLGDRWEDVFHNTCIAFWEALRTDGFQWQGVGQFLSFIHLLMQQQIPSIDQREVPLPVLPDRGGPANAAERDLAKSRLLLAQVRLLTAIQIQLKGKQRVILEADLKVFYDRLNSHEARQTAADIAKDEHAVSNRHKGLTKLRQVFSCSQSSEDSEVCAMISHIWGAEKKRSSAGSPA